ncbi:MAG: hypothetical protein C6Y22_14065 [Hapalosiphonaceae cyanobacterium JJU2]|nr:MAG: hypothetical protein C6Y22_14065 [Hapalosiphonaceae cyanobacterium JJU2]
MEGFSIEELTSIALTFKEYENIFPSPRMFIDEIKCGITFDREGSKDEIIRKFYEEHSSIDEDALADKLYKFLENQPSSFEKLYLAINKFWEVEVVNLQERLRELKVIQV